MDNLLRRIERRFVKGVMEYGLLADGDHILVALSGGKDSLAMLELLARRSRIFHPRFSLVAAHVVMRNIPYRSDVDYLREVCASWNVPFVLVEAEFDASLDHRKSPCFLCSWNRRKALFTLAREQGCNKIALGHHMDDIIHTAMMNMFFQGSSSTMPVRLKMRKMPLTIVRPLCLEAESDLRKYAEYNGYRKQIKLCPYESDSHRADMKGLFGKIEAMNDEARYSVWTALEKEGKLVEE